MRLRQAIAIASLSALACAAAVAEETAPAAANPNPPMGAIPANLANAPLAGKVGMEAPLLDAKLKNVDGKEISISDVKGEKGTLVVFTCNACPFAKAWEERIVSVGNSAKGRGVGVIAINPNDPGRVPEDDYATMQSRAKDKGFGFPYAADAGSKVARAFGAQRTPEVFLLDTKGTVVYHGAVDDNAESAKEVKESYLRDALDALVAGRDIPVKETKAMGCTIKWQH